MFLTQRVSARALMLFSSVLGALLGVAVAARPIAAEPNCPNTKCNFISGYCEASTVGGKYCTHVGGSQGCYKNEC